MKRPAPWGKTSRSSPDPRQRCAGGGLNAPLTLLRDSIGEGAGKGAVRMAGTFAYLAFAAISLLTAAAAVVAAARLAPVFGWPGARRGSGRVALPDVSRRYRFRGDYLLSPLPPDDAFLPPGTDRARALSDLSAGLSRLNADLPEHLDSLKRSGKAFLLTSHVGPDAFSISGRAEGADIVLHIAPADARDGREIVSADALSALRAEVAHLRRVAEAAPMALWREDATGDIVWANAAYLALADRVGAAAHWPPPRLFAAQLSPPPDPARPRRCSLPPAGAAGTAWFDVAWSPVDPDSAEAEGGETLWSARPIDRLVTAEDSLRRFVQTLTQTFAHLPTGLAVFDRQRELVIFNPALVTQTRLPIAFLSGRPSLTAMLDRLRETGRMPEPRDYRAWRDEIARLEADAEAGTYEDLWTLPGGDSLQVIGRPHPDGAIAFLFEDVSQGMGQIRAFRASIATYEALLDGEAAALLIVDGKGRVPFLNAAMRARLAGAAALRDGADTPPLLEALLPALRSGFAPTAFWSDLARAARGDAARHGLRASVETRAGARMLVEGMPLPGGALALRLRDETGAARAPEAPRRAAGFAEPDAPGFDGAAKPARTGGDGQTAAASETDERPMAPMPGRR